ncbi:hypothetical protein LCGC14_0349860 [marine sediment metagenome]|uniref:Uncharacterized protein n=1 Tax=marine sediment metagenome TaxID=412755 RepID=A0A0F9TGS1_9ZZZZ
MKNISGVTDILRAEPFFDSVASVWKENKVDKEDCPSWHIYTYKEDTDGVMGIDTAITPIVLSKLNRGGVECLARMIKSTFLLRMNGEQNGR